MRDLRPSLAGFDSRLGAVSFVLFCCVLLVGAGPPSVARAEPLSAKRVAALARSVSPSAKIAATQTAEARGGLVDARRLALDNPSIEASRGESDQGDISDVEVTVPLGFGLRRSRQVAEARSALARDQFLESDAMLHAVADALRGYYAILHAEQRIAIATERRDLAKELVRIANERVEVGDAARLEIVIAEAEFSRAQSEILAEQHDAIHARTQLAITLGLSDAEELQVVGDLKDRSILDIAIAAPPETRDDVLAAQSDLEASKAAASGARTEMFPDFSFRLLYEQADGDEFVRPGVVFTVPLFDRGQGLRAQTDARRDRAEIQLAARRAAVSVEATGARLAYERMTASAEEMELRAVPRALELEDLAEQSFAAGKVDLTTLLVVQGSALDTRREHADRLLRAALSGIDLTLAVGAMPE